MYDAVDELSKQTLPTVSPVAFATNVGFTTRIINEESNVKMSDNEKFCREFFESEIIL
jgi:hypothetical protein